MQSRLRSLSRERSASWKGGRRIMGDGYVGILLRGHPRCSNNGYVREHILIVEAVLGKPLPEKAEVHHVDLDRANNANSNLVVCEDRAYHSLLHVRLRALQACGDPNARHCRLCKKYDRQHEMYRWSNYAAHIDCTSKANRRQHAARRARRARVA